MGQRNSQWSQVEASLLPANVQDLAQSTVVTCSMQSRTVQFEQVVQQLSSQLMRTMFVFIVTTAGEALYCAYTQAIQCTW